MEHQDVGEAKTRTFATRKELLDKLGEKEKLAHRQALDAADRRAEYESASQRVLDGAMSVTVGRTTYVISE
ncbi:hypothetical protein [Streptomyces sp. NPDC003832]